MAAGRHQGRLQLELEVNGQPRSVEVGTSTVLAELLRDDLGLTGVRLSCERSVCGSCTVLIDGEATASCSVFAFEADGAAVQTVEGLAQDGRLSAEQQAFAECGGFQCGYCTSGMLMLTRALLTEHPQPDRTTIREWINSNICRCTGYEMIFESVERAARLRACGESGSR